MRFNFLSSLGLLSTLANVPLVRSANVCFLLYQMADNDLEYDIMQDLGELSRSELIKTPTVTTWVYFDHRNFGTEEYDDDNDVRTPMSFVFNKDGSAQTGEKPQGSFYFRQDHSQQKLVIEKDLGELNSDLSTTVENFINTGLADCKAQGAEEHMIVFSSHGGGFDGFGGDDNERKLLQTNSDIAGAMRSALEANLGAGSKFDVVGFDACLMQAFGVADDYKSVANYILASEELEPGHGWWYQDAPQGASGSALDIAKYFQTSFLTELQGDYHQTPKTLSIVDLNKFETSFLVKWEALSKELTSLLRENDPEVSIMLGRARKTAYAVESVLDDTPKDPSSIDMYSFMETFRGLCPSETGTTLDTALRDAMTAYEDMFVVSGNGPNTPSGLTGMHILFPTKRFYAKDSDQLQLELFNDASKATQGAPEWLNFLKTFYSSGTPAEGGTSVCQSSSTSSVTPSKPNQLLINPTVSDIRNGLQDISTEVARSVDSVLVEYGADFTPLLQDRRRSLGKVKRVSDRQKREGKSRSIPRYGGRFRRQMKAISERRRLDDETSTIAPSMETSIYDDYLMNLFDDDVVKSFVDTLYGDDFDEFSTIPPTLETSTFDDDFETSTLPPSLDGMDDDFLFTDEEYLFIFAGDLLGNFDKSKYSASWDRNFWALGDANGDFDAIYVHDMGEGFKDAPVIYIPPSRGPITSLDVEDILSIDDAIDNGGELGFLTFSTNNRDDLGFVTSVSLYTISADDSYSEVPLSKGGQIVPIIYCTGLGFDEFVGGFSNTVLDWSANNRISITTFDAVEYMDSYGVDYLTIDIVGEDEDTGGSSYAFFEIDRDGVVDFLGQEDIPGTRTTAGSIFDGGMDGENDDGGIDGENDTRKNKIVTSASRGTVASFGLLLVTSTLCLFNM